MSKTSEKVTKMSGKSSKMPGKVTKTLKKVTKKRGKSFKMNVKKAHWRKLRWKRRPKRWNCFYIRNDQFTTFIEFGWLIQFYSIWKFFYERTLKKVAKMSTTCQSTVSEYCLRVLSQSTGSEYWLRVLAQSTGSEYWCGLLWFLFSGTPSQFGILTLKRERRPRDASETWQVQIHKYL